MNDIFHILADEAEFTSQILRSGVTQIGKANYALKGKYFQAFISLSTGLERIGKICLILNYYIDQGGKFPDSDYFKTNFGHNLIKLFNESKMIIKTNKFKFQFIDSLDDEIQISIIKILSQFATGDRYRNLNLLTNQNVKNNPISIWSKEIDDKLYEKHISAKKKKRIDLNAKIVANTMGHFSIVLHSNEKGEIITDLEETSRMTGKFEAVKKYRQLYVSQIIRYWVEILDKLQNGAMNLGKQEIPSMTEMFAIFYNEDSYLKTRTNFDRDR